MTDPLDDLLGRSAPTLAGGGGERDTAIRQMVQDARDTARPPKRSRRRVGVLSGALALVFAGGAGVATATDLFPWTQEQENPFVAVDFTLPSGLSCEQRIFVVDAADPAAGEWLRGFAADNDLLSLANVDGYLHRMAGWGESEPNDDLRYWRAVNGSLWRS